MKLFHQEQIESYTIISSNWLIWFDLVQAIQSHCKQSRNLCLIFFIILSTGAARQHVSHSLLSTPMFLGTLPVTSSYNFHTHLCVCRSAPALASPGGVIVRG